MQEDFKKDEQKESVQGHESEVSKKLQVFVSEPKKEKYDPEKGLEDRLEETYLLLRWITESNVGTMETERPIFPLGVRKERAQQLKKLKELRKLRQQKREERHKASGRGDVEERGEIELTDDERWVIKEIEAIKENERETISILKKFLRQGEVEVRGENFGDAKARYTAIDPSPEKEIKGKPPIVLIPGIANDLACVSSIARELAENGRKVIVIAFPEGYMGEMSEKFVKNVQESEGYRAHVDFFESAIKGLLPEGEFELWGFSTGGPISAQMLTDNPELSKRVTDAVLVAPVGSVEQSKTRIMSVGGGLETLNFIGGDRKDVPNFFLTLEGRKIPEDVRPLTPAERNKRKGFRLLLRLPKLLGNITGFGLTLVKGGRSMKDDTGRYTSEERQKREDVFDALLERVIHVSQDFETMRVQDGGNIIVVNYEKDQITRSKELFNAEDCPDNEQIKELINLSGRHNGPIIKPEELVGAVVASQEKEN